MTVRTAAVLAMLAVASTFAQQSETPPPPRTIEVVNLGQLQQLPEVPEPPEPPPGANAWSLRIHTTGGFTGRGVGSVTISSDGRMACGPAPCATPVAAARLDPFGKAIDTAVVEAFWRHQPPATLCSDCVRTTLALKRRDGDVVRVYHASWDDSQPVMPELRELRRLALELRTARAAR
jgi:hypothetical protein